LIENFVALENAIGSHDVARVKVQHACDLTFSTRFGWYRRISLSLNLADCESLVEPPPDEPPPPGLKIEYAVDASAAAKAVKRVHLHTKTI
jgi:hypothetical protein